MNGMKAKATVRPCCWLWRMDATEADPRLPHVVVGPDGSAVNRNGMGRNHGPDDQTDVTIDKRIANIILRITFKKDILELLLRSHQISRINLSMKRDDSVPPSAAVDLSAQALAQSAGDRYI